MTETCNMRFTEIVKEGIENGHRIVHGWSETTGQTGRWAYPMYAFPDWEFDPNYRDIGGRGGTHGGCAG